MRAFEDRAISGASASRPGFQALQADAERGCFEVVVCEAIDRLSRKLSDVAALHDRLEFRRIALHAASLGAVTTMHVGLLGTMAQLYLSDLKDKTRRGLLGRVLQARPPAAGPMAFASSVTTSVGQVPGASSPARRDRYR
jgi:DNA invertase Pin-like site-specific DNA recombinase